MFVYYLKLAPYISDKRSILLEASQCEIKDSL